MRYNSHLSASGVINTVVSEGVTVNDELRQLLESYSTDQTTIEEIRYWVGLHIWDSSDDADGTVDHLAIELSHLDDGLVDESYFRIQVQVLLTLNISEAEWDTAPAGPPILAVPGSSTEVAATNIVHIDSERPFIGDEPIRAAQSFA